MERNYHVNVEMKTNIVNAFMYFKESVTDNEVVFVKTPTGWWLKYFTIDNVEYEVDHYIGLGANFSTDNLGYWNTNTNRRVKGEKRLKELNEVLDSIIEKGTEYLNSLYNCNFKYCK